MRGVFCFVFLFAILYPPTIFSENHSLTLRAVEQTLIVHGKKSKVFNLLGPNGEGYQGTKGKDFNVLLKNETSVPISIHWHGIILPNDQDGVPYVTQLPIQPGQTHPYHFPLVQAGTYWMHSHFQFHEQELMAAPLIIKDPEDAYKNDKEVILFLHDFTFKKPENILLELKEQAKKTKMTMPKMDLNDVDYDAVLANRRTLSNPEIVSVKPGEKIRLRIINGASASNFWVYTGELLAEAIAVDGEKIVPFSERQFQIANAQRIDVEISIPKKGGVFPILAQIEGTKKQSGIILTTPNKMIPKLNEQAEKVAPPLNDQQEIRLHPLRKLKQKPVDRTLNYVLTGSMNAYVWKINNEVWPHIKPLKIKKGERVEMIFVNNTAMAHPMHLHGHVFQVTEIDGKRLANGPLRDTILVLPHSTKKIIFDADNPGIWMNHCHVLYHMNAGMMTTTNYDTYPEPDFYRKLIK